MMKLLRLALACVIFASGTAHATLFNFSYQFGSGDQITGSLTGTLSGAYVTGASNINVFLNGVAFNGNGALFANTFVSCCYWTSAIAASISTDPSLNNFVFVDVNDFSYGTMASTHTNSFHMSRNIYFSPVNQAHAWNGTLYLFDEPMIPTWSLTAVPEPGTMALMGLALLAAGASRKRRA